MRLRLVARAAHQRGVAILELIVGLAMVALLGIYGNKYIVNQLEESLAVGAGAYMKLVASAAQRYALNNFTALSAGGPVAGAANSLQPTLAELRAMGLGLNPGFPDGTSTRQQVRIDILRNACPGANCVLVANICTTTGLTLGGADAREDLALIAVRNMDGKGGLSRIGEEGTVRGPTFSVPNPIGNVASVLCAQDTVDTSLFNRFITIRDTRDPDLQGSLTVAGPTTINNSVTVTQTITVGGCIGLEGSSGRAGFGCRDRNDIPVGYTGGERSADVVADRNIVASNNPSGFTGSNGNYAILTADNGSGVAEIRTSGRNVGDRLTPTGLYASGAACAAADEGSIARRSDAAGGLVVCTSGTWQPLLTYGVRGQACGPDGATGITAAGVGLYCQSGFWALLSDRFGWFAVTDTYIVQDGTSVPKPACRPGGTGKIYFNPQGVDTRAISDTQSVVNFRADETTGNYVIYADVSVGQNAPRGAATSGYGLAVVGCYYD